MIIIGSDECLKGDTFGGIVVAAVKADDDVREKLVALGVRDSKTMTDNRIREISTRIKRIAKYAVENVYPEEFNKHKMTEIMNKLHAKVGKSLGAGKHVVDKYPGCNVGDEIIEKAESEYVEAAAASIIARAEALKQIEDLGKKAGFRIPLGSTHVREALLRLKESGKDPSKFVKTGFKNVKVVFSS